MFKTITWNVNFQMAKVIHQLLAMLIALGAQSAYADEPLAPPSRTSAVSSNGKFTAVSDPKSQKTTVADSLGNKLWDFPGWHRSIFISDDGQSVAIGYDGLNLIPAYDANLELVTFWSNGKKVRTVKLYEIVPTASMLTRTTSHYYWGQIEGVGAKGRLVLVRSDGKRFSFNMSTGTTE